MRSIPSLPTSSDAKVTGAPPFRLSRTDIPSLLKGLAIAVAGTLLTYAATNLIPLLSTTDYLWLEPIALGLVNTFQRWLLNTQKIEIPLDQRTIIVTPQEAAQPMPSSVETVVIVQPDSPPMPPP